MDDVGKDHIYLIGEASHCREPYLKISSIYMELCIRIIIFKVIGIGGKEEQFLPIITLCLELSELVL